MNQNEPRRQWARVSRFPERWLLGEVYGAVLRRPVASVTRAAVLTAPVPPEGLPDVETAALAAKRSGFGFLWEAQSPGGELMSGPAMTLVDACRAAEHTVFGPLVTDPFTYRGGFRGGFRRGLLQ